MLALGLAVFMIVGLALYMYVQLTYIETTHYHITVPDMPRSLKGTKIVHLSDIHFPRQGVNTKDLINRVENLQPELIFVTGDIIHGEEPLPEDQVKKLATGLANIAPTYAVTGNHDINSGFLEELEEILVSCGVRVLNDEAEWFHLGEDRLVIMGLLEKPNFDEAYRPLLKDIELTEEMQSGTKLLLAHHPELFEDYMIDLTRLPDLIFSGHAHGGQVRIPFMGAIAVPQQGWHPYFTDGVYPHKDMPGKRMIVSRGIGSSSFPIRIHNRPQVIVVTLN